MKIVATTEILTITKVKGNKKNPRLIKNDKFKQLVTSIKQTPEMMMLRPLLLDENNIILGGNMRWKACKELNWETVPTQTYSRAIHKESESWTVYGKTYEAVCDEILIKDNTHYGVFDYDILANEWETQPLVDWGLDLWINSDKNNLDAESEWTDMPEFQQEDLTPSRQLIISFRNEKDVQEFAKLIQQKITDKTKSLWHPLAENEKQFDKTYE